jgi:hypothetical protein
MWEHWHRGERYYVQVARLAAVAWYGFDAVTDNIVHHTRNIPWLNAEPWLEPMGVHEHRVLHATEDGRKLLWRDKRWLREQYKEQEMSMKELADKADCSPSTIQKWLDKHGIETRDKSVRNDQ